MVGIVNTGEIIEGILVRPLKQILDDRGAVLHMLRSDSVFFTKFGEIYFSEVMPGARKAWKRHKKMTQNFAVPTGRIFLVLYDSREGSPTNGNIFSGYLGRPDHYNLVRIPPMIWYGFQGIADTPSLIANCPDLPHDPAEAEKIPENTDLIPYSWSF